MISLVFCVIPGGDGEMEERKREMEGDIQPKDERMQVRKGYVDVVCIHY